MATKKNTPPAKPSAATESASVQQAQSAVQNQAETATAPAAETASANPAPEKPAPPKAAQKGSAGWVMATLKSRHCDGGVCKEAGKEMRMTRGTYERLKQFDRVE
tara:strand:- start:6656 stop:6970 length:315 start_codon:yes stop_codon:yes gene_type:complete